MKASFFVSPAVRTPGLFARILVFSIALAFTLALCRPTTAAADESCVLLRNGNVLFGSVTQIGSTISITGLDQSKIRLPSDQVETIGHSLEELYQYRRNHRFEGDLKRVQADVRWCLQNGLIREAGADVLHARSLDPSNPQTVQLLRQITAMMKKADGGGTPAESEEQNPLIRTVSHETVPTVESPIPREQLDSEDSGLPEKLVYVFTTRIQPILMNRCTRCHAKDDANKREFQIHTALTSKWAPKDVAQENLQAVMKYVDLSAPQNSLIRIRASDGHGGRRHSLGNEGSAMMSNLDHWLYQLPDAHSASRWDLAIQGSDTADYLAPTSPPDLSPVDQVSSTALATGIPELPARIETQSSWPMHPIATEAAPRMRRMPKVENPFDPEIFNRRVHGQ